MIVTNDKGGSVMRVSAFLTPFFSLGLFLSGPLGATEAPADAVQIASPPSSGTDTVSAPPSLVRMLENASLAVVNISVQGRVRITQDPLSQDPLFRRFVILPEQAPQNQPTEHFQSVGSGVIFDARQGYVITNNHVVNRADKILVTLKDRRRLEAKVVGTDPQTDIAVLKVEPDRLTALPAGDAKALQVGEYVVAIGNPFGLGQTATFGIVSALGRTGLGIEGYEDFIQTDAAINPGNSGGALIDMAGRLIGINTAIFSRGGGSVGIGFAVPIDMIELVTQQLIASGKVSRGALGVALQDLTPPLAQAMGVDALSGAVVSQVLPQSAAAKAGIDAGDVIIAVDGKPVTGSSPLRNEIGRKQPGTIVRLTLLRDGRERTVTTTLDTLASTASEIPAVPHERELLSGLTLGAIPGDDPRYGKVSGVYIASVEPGSLAEEAGIRQGDIIVSAGRTPVKTPDELVRIMSNQTKGTPLLLQLRRGELDLFAAIG
jgi:Do/DeqQ family serine protease